MGARCGIRTISGFPLVEHIQNQPNNDLLLRGVGGGDEQRQGCQGVVVDLGFAVFVIQNTVFVQKEDKQIGADAFVAVVEWGITNLPISTWKLKISRTTLYIMPISAEAVGNTIQARLL